jgi:trimeric autotransporter adhesin
MIVSSDTSKVTVTPNVFIPAGWTIPNGALRLTGVNLGTVTIMASASGYLSDSQQARVTGTIRFVNCCIGVIRTTTQEAVLNLSGPAPVGGLTVNLSSENPAVATVPATVTFPASATSVNVPIKGIARGSTVIHANALPNLTDVSIKVAVP